MKIYKLLLSMLLLPLLMFTACQDDQYEMGEMLDKSQIDFEVQQPLDIDEGGNTVVLINRTPRTVSMWDYGTGRSNRMVDTVRFAFQGEYTIQFSAMTAGGIVAMDPVTIQVTEDNLNYVSDPLWTMLSGGPGEEKTWLLDLNEEGISKYFNGPLYFYGIDRDVNWECTNPDNEDVCWSWDPDYAGNTWLMPTGDYGTMTFNLKGGPYVTVDHRMLPGRGLEEGTYFLDSEERTLTLTDASPLHNEGNDACVANWGDVRIVSLTENTMQLAVLRRESCDGAVYLVYNYISQEYADNWVPDEDGPEEDPNFNHGNQGDILAVDRTTTKTWKLDLEVPFNWTDLEGNFLNEWSSRSDYPAWASYNDAAVANITDAAISFSEDGTVEVQHNDGTIEMGTYSIDESTNLITFSGVRPSIHIAGDITATTTADNQWKIVRVERNSMDQVVGIWFGQRAPDKPEYMVFHFRLQTGAGGGGNAQLTPEQEMTRALTGHHTANSSRTFKIDTNWPVDWTNLQGEGGWTAEGVQAEPGNNWYWDAATEASVENQRLTFSLINGELSVTKLDAEGNTSSSPVTLNAGERKLHIPDTDIIAFEGAGSWLPTAGPDYKWVRGSYGTVATDGFWLGVKTPDKDEYTIYRYILE